MSWWIYLIWILVVWAIAIGFALDWRWDRTHFTAQDDERLEAPKETDKK